MKILFTSVTDSYVNLWESKEVISENRPTGLKT